VPGFTGGVKPAGIVKFTGDEDANNNGCGIEPEPVMIAPLKSPSIDCEFANARRICGCAGMVTVNGTWEIATGVGAGATAPTAPEDQHVSIAKPDDASAAVMRRCVDLVSSLCINNSLRLAWLSNDRLQRRG
jgi:hypothetical protein